MATCSARRSDSSCRKSSTTGCRRSWCSRPPQAWLRSLAVRQSPAIGSRVALLAVFVVTAALPIRFTAIDEGVIETDVTPDAVVEIHTIGGRLRPLLDLGTVLTGAVYPYILFEPGALEHPDGLRASIVGAGYTSIFSNAQGELFVQG